MNGFELAKSIDYGLKHWGYADHKKITEKAMEIICDRDKYSLITFYKKLKKISVNDEGSQIIITRYIDFLSKNNPNEKPYKPDINELQYLAGKSYIRQTN